MAFQSKFQDDEKLRNCAVADQHHVGESYSPTGPWVALIKEALNAWASRQSTPLAPLPVTDTFDKATGDRVALYKRSQVPPILNYAGQIDRVVGRKTVAALDLELPKRGEAPIEATHKVDIVIGLKGAGRNEEFHFEDDALPSRLILPYLQKHVLSLDSKKERSLKRFGALTVTIGAQSAPLIASLTRKIESAIGNNQQFGEVCIWGSSSGGRNALDLAHRLSRRGVPLSYVAVLDAAFFPQDTGDRPTSRFNAASQRPPLFRLFHGIRAKIRKNHFQTEGNLVKIVKHDLLSGLFTLQWTSDMAGEEIHGDVLDFKPFAIRSGLGSDDPHGALISRKKGEVLNDIAALLNPL